MALKAMFLIFHNYVQGFVTVSPGRVQDFDFFTT